MVLRSIWCMTIQNPRPVPLHVWQRSVALVAFVGYPLAALFVVHLWKSVSFVSAGAVALALAAVGTTWRIWADAKQLGDRLAREPERRAETLQDLGAGFYAWGVVCLAAWMGFFSQVLG